MSNATIYQIQAQNSRGIWDASFVDDDPYATDFATMAEAEEELDNLVTIQGLDRATLRIREVSNVR